MIFFKAKFEIFYGILIFGTLGNKGANESPDHVLHSPFLPQHQAHCYLIWVFLTSNRLHL